MDSILNKITLSKGAKILKFDVNGIVAIFKPSGILSHPNDARQKKSALINARYSYKNEKYSILEKKSLIDDSIVSDRIDAYLLNRLDIDTSGVIMVAINQQSLADEIKSLFKNRLVMKKYHAVVFESNITNKISKRGHIVWNDDIEVPDYNNNKMVTKIATTEVKLIKRYPRSKMLLLELLPVTGFTHQLRHQCRNRGYPIVGDRLYGDFKKNKEFILKLRKKFEFTKFNSDVFYHRQFLHSSEIDFQYEYLNNKYEFNASCPLPVEYDTFFP